MIHDQIRGFAFDNRQVWLRFHFAQHRFAIQFAIRLGTRPLYCRAFTAVQQAKLDARHIRNTPHHAVHRVNFADQMALTQSTNCRVTGHDTNSGACQCDQCRARPHARRCVGRITTRVTATNHHNIEVELFHVKHPLLPKTKAGKNFVQHIFHINPSNQRIQGADRRAQFFGSQIGHIFTGQCKPFRGL